MSHIDLFSWIRVTVNALNFWTLIACQKGLNKLGRLRSDCFWGSSLIRVFPVCYSDMHFVNFGPDNQHFIWEQKEKSVRNFRTFTVMKILFPLTLTSCPYWCHHRGYSVRYWWCHHLCPLSSPRRVYSLPHRYTSPLQRLRDFVLFVWFDTLRPINNLSVIKGWVFLGWTSNKLGLMFLLKDTTQWRRWGSNPPPFGLKSSTLPLSHCAP